VKPGALPVVTLAQAKVNLALAVTGIRPDGYHELRSLFLRIALGDVLTVRAGTAAGPDTLVVHDDPDCPVEGNLVLRAATALRAALPDGAALPALAFALRKRIPIGGGLGGGSADGAAALHLALRAWGRSVPGAELLALAGRVGADLPFLVAGVPAAEVTGIGERIVPLPALRSAVGILLCIPPGGLSTPAVFRARDALPPPGPHAAAAVAALVADWPALDGPALAARAAGLRDANDLWPGVAALDPALARTRDALETRLGVPVLLTGSGSTLVGLYPSPDAARAAAEVVAGSAGALGQLRAIATTDDRGADDEEAR
jgi:4-diphosphocytidyl-2-C-methyl-D-erythritol kinase